MKGAFGVLAATPTGWAPPLEACASGTLVRGDLRPSCSAIAAAWWWRVFRFCAVMDAIRSRAGRDRRARARLLLKRSQSWL